MDKLEQSINNEASQQYKFYAFISYNSKDTEWGKRVQGKLEHYRMPVMLCRERGWKRTPINPVFFAPTDIQPGGLSNELKERLRSSRNLIVICSPHSAQSEWVGKEIEYFHSLGRTDNIHFFIVDGVPHSGNADTECFNPIVEQLGLPEILGANIHEKNYRWPWMNRERAYVQLVSKLLGVEFDALWQRHRRRLVRRVITWIIGVIAVLAVIGWVWASSQPFDAQVRLNETSFHNEQLPPLHDAVVTLTLDNETKTDTIHDHDGAVTFTNVPHEYLNRQVHITVNMMEDPPDYMPVDTTITLTRNVVLDIKRNPSKYGDVRFMLWDPNMGTSIPNIPIEVDGHPVTSDQDGQVALFIPLEQQKGRYHVKAPFGLNVDTIYMPSGENDAIERR